ncbi:unknown [Firmicutes bacterium CAG:582]|nr:unknown [Firmicutes bacterium CAG:582]
MMDDDKIPQINRVAKVIKVDEQDSNDVKPSGDFMCENTHEKHREEHDPSTAIFITIILIIIAAFLFFIVYIYIPNKKVIANIPTKTTSEKKNKYYFNVIDISLNDISTEFSYSLNKFKINVVSGNGKNQILVNNVNIGECDRLEPRVSIVDNILFLFLKNNLPRQNRLIGINEDGKIIVNLTGVNSLSGMSLEKVSFNTDSINLEVSRIYDGKLILSSNFGDTTGSPLCNSKDSKDLLVLGNYELSYKGNKEMNELVLISGSSISEYVKANNLC